MDKVKAWFRQLTGGSRRKFNGGATQKSTSGSSSDFFDFGTKQRRKNTLWIVGGATLAVAFAIVVVITLLRPTPTVRENIVIGNTTITPEHVDRNADALRDHLQRNPAIVVEDPDQQALEDLVMNAAFHHYNTTRCNVEVTPQDVLRAFGRDVHEAEAKSMLYSLLGAPGDFMRVRMENMVFRERLEECLIDEREILYLGISVAAFFAGDDQPSTEMFEEGKRKLREEYVPLLDQGMSAGEIVERVNTNRTNDSDGMVLWDINAILSGVIGCTVEVGGCLLENERAAEHTANFGHVYRMWDQATRLREVGDTSELFLSNAGMITVIRLEGRSGGGYASWDEFMEGIRERYVYTWLSMTLNRIANITHDIAYRVGTALRILPESAYASALNHDHRRSTPLTSGNCAPFTQARCDMHPLTIHMAARTVSGLPLRGWEYNPQLRNGCCATELRHGVGIPTSNTAATFVRILHNCDGPGPWPDDVFPSSMVRHPEGFEHLPLQLGTTSTTPTADQAVIVHRVAHTDPNQPVPDMVPGPMRWIHPSEPNWLNRHQSVSMIFIYPEIMDPVFQSRSSVTALCPTGVNCTRQLTQDTNTSDWDATITQRITIPDNVEGDVVVQIGFHHDMRRIDEGQAEATSDWNVAATAEGATAIQPGNPGPPSATVTLVGGDEEEVSRTNAVSVTIPAPAAGTTSNMIWRQRISYNDSSMAELIIERGAPPEEEIPCGGECDPGTPETPPPWADVFSSHVRARALINNQVREEAPIACHPGLAGHTSGSWLTGMLGCESIATETERVYARPQHNISFGWQGQLVALHSRTVENATNRINFPPFHLRYTLCGESNASSEGRDCAALTPPGTQLQINTIHPAPSPALRNEWEMRGENLAGIRPTAPGQNMMNPSLQTHQGGGHTVRNNLLGRRDIDLTISVQDAVSKRFQNCSDGPGTSDFVGGNGPLACTQNLHQYRYEFRQRHTRTLPRTAAADCGTGSCMSCSWSYACGSYPTYPCPGPGGGTCGGGTMYCSTSGTSCSQCGRYPDGGCSAGSTTQQWFGGGANHHSQSPAPVSCCSSVATNLSDGPIDRTVGGIAGGPGTYYENRYTWVKRSDSGPVESTARFGVPYNYYIVPHLNFFPSNANRIQVGGTELGWNASLRVNPRHNELVGETYATATRPDTRWAVIKFYVGPNRTSDPNAGMNLEPNAGVGANPCSFVTFDNNGANGLMNAPWGCTSTTGQGQLNLQSDTNPFNLLNGSTFNLGMESEVLADAPIGTKFCVAVAAMDRDSTHNEGFGHESAGRWAVTQPECVVIGKKPMTNVLGDGLYSDGAVEGAIFDKRPFGQSDFGSFGSWVEYEIVSAGPVRTIASGAALGIGAIGVPTANAPNNFTMVPRSVQVGSCSIATLTFRNSNCSPFSHAQPLGEMAGASNAYGLARNIRHRYTNVTNATSVSGSISLNSHQGDRMNNLRSDGALTINASTIQPGRTVIIDSTGPVTIAGNIILHDGPYTDISQIPQVLIFAPSITINENVTRIDSWLLAGLNGGTGTINTCAGITNVNQLNGNICTNHLRVNGPVMASRILLHRTYGAGMGMPASARPAEAFFLSPATYLWAWNQSELLRQAFLTYAREVAPRF